MQGLLKYIFIHIVVLFCVFYVLKLRDDVDTLSARFNDFKRNHFHCFKDKVVTGPPGVYSSATLAICSGYPGD